MKTSLLCVLLACGLSSPALQAQNAPPTAREARNQAALSAQLFYQLLLAEMSVTRGEPGAAISLLLDAARRTGDEQVFKRAADIALSARAGDAALQVARNWRQAQPRSLDAHRYLVQILLGLNRVADSAEPLRSLIELTPDTERTDLLERVPGLYARASDRRQATTAAEQALAPALAQARTAASAWTAVARLRANQPDPVGALDAVQRAQAAQPRHVGAALVATELMDSRRPQAEALVRRYLDAATPAAAEVRMNYARRLLDLQRLPESEAQLERLTQEQPDQADAWLLLGSLQLDTPRLAQAQDSLQRYLALTQAQAARHERGRAQAQLMLAQAAEKRGDLAAAERWLQLTPPAELLLQVQTRRAMVLGRQGRLQEGLELIRRVPEREPGDARAKLLAETQVLREFKQYQSAHDLLARATINAPQDADLLYEQALMAEKLGRHDHMEQLLRRVLAFKPDHYASYNALGYSLADRGIRLQEAKQLILKALQFAPDDPYIQDSLAWVEFRLGNKQEALRVIEMAYKARPDAEIAAHFGEILWSLEQRDRALVIWREGLTLNADNETLRETLQRLNARP